MPSFAKRSDSIQLLLCPAAPDHIEMDWLDSQYWEERNAITGSSRGRSATYFVKDVPEDNNIQADAASPVSSHSDQTSKDTMQADTHYALRHYHRGGMIRHLLRDHYWYTGRHNTRVYQELDILEKMQDWKLPAPVPVAGRVIRKGCYYRADILMQKIANAKDLYEILRQRPIGVDVWRRIGSTIAQFHEHGVYHADLNCHNIMLDAQEKVWLIDFDRAALQAPAESWQSQNMGRLYRSFNKEKELREKAHSTPFYFTEPQWEHLLRGYDEKGA